MDNSSPVVTTPKKTPRSETNKNPRNQNTLTEKAKKYYKNIAFVDKLNDSSKTHVCQLCNSQLNGSKESNLAGHIKRVHPEAYLELIGEIDTPAVQRLKLLQNLVEIVTVNGRNFSYLTDSGFKAVIGKQLKSLSATGFSINLTNKNVPEVKDHLHKIAEKMKEKIKQETKNRPISLMVDIVTRQRRSICGFSIQYTINGERKIRSVGMIELLQSHTGKHIADVIEKRLAEFDITFKQIITITTDNGSNVLKMVRDINAELKARMESARSATTKNTVEVVSNENECETEHTDDLIDDFLANEEDYDENSATDDDAYEQLYAEMDCQNEPNNNQTLLNAISSAIFPLESDVWDVTGVHCAAHTLQLAIRDGINMLPRRFQNVIELARRVGKFLRLKSTTVKLEEAGIDYNLPRLENDTRWCSLYHMVYFLLFCFCLFCNN